MTGRVHLHALSIHGCMYMYTAIKFACVHTCMYMYMYILIAHKLRTIPIHVEVSQQMNTRWSTEHWGVGGGRGVSVGGVS